MACAAPASDPYRPWQAADLRVLDIRNQGGDPALDLTAAWVRTAGSDLEIRVDPLDMLTPSDSDFYLVFDLGPGGSDQVFLGSGDVSLPFEADLLLTFPAGDSPQVTALGNYRPSSGLVPRISRDPQRDTITVSVNRNSLPADFRALAYTSAPGDQNPTYIGPFGLRDNPPPEHAMLLLAFTGSLPARSPAEALRRWDGAHTGPRGGRHGLRPLLEAAQQNRIPLALLDLKTPASLAALDTLGGLPLVQELQAQNLLLLPEVISEWDPRPACASCRQIDSAFGLDSTPYAYGTFSPPAGFRYLFPPLPIGEAPLRAGNLTLLPQAGMDESLQPTPDGPALDLRRRLLESAFEEQSDLIVLGGNLPDSLWGDPAYAAPTLAWIAARPWIQVLDAGTLRHIPAGKTDMAFRDLHSRPDRPDFQDALRAAPDNTITDLAGETFTALTLYTDDEQLTALRRTYLGTVGHLLAAADWAEHPGTIADCDHDPDRDGQAECILADKDYFALFESDGARLVLFFHHETQWIGSSAQFAVGLSDPSTWRLDQGEAADPAIIPGAFADVDDPWRPYEASFVDGGLAFIADGRTKTFRLDGDGLRVDYAGDPIFTDLALAFDPLARRAPGWAGRDHLQAGEQEIAWRRDSGPGLAVQTSGVVTMRSFLEGLDLLALPEHPDRAYPPGHTLPFPLTLVQVGGEAPLWIALHEIGD